MRSPDWQQHATELKKKVLVYHQLNKAKGFTTYMLLLLITHMKAVRQLLCNSNSVHTDVPKSFLNKYLSGFSVRWSQFILVNVTDLHCYF